MKLLTLGVSLVMLTGCASVPKQLQNEPISGMQVNTVQGMENCKVELPVRWGGVVSKVESTNKGSYIEVVSKALSRNTRPKETDISYGRFIIFTEKFVEPKIFKSGREVTVLGNVESCVEGKIDKMDYRFPLVKTIGLHLWKPRPVEPDVVIYPSLWLYDSWPHPYRYPRPVRHRHPHGENKPADDKKDKDQ